MVDLLAIFAILLLILIFILLWRIETYKDKMEELESEVRFSKLIKESTEKFYIQKLDHANRIKYETQDVVKKYETAIDILKNKFNINIFRNTIYIEFCGSEVASVVDGEKCIYRRLPKEEIDVLKEVFGDE